MSFTIKICGLSTPDAVDTAINAGADMLGFVFFKKSPRNISFETARRLSTQVKDRALKVALTVDADDPTLAALIAELKPQRLQLHGHETPRRVFDIRARFGLPVIKALSLAEKQDLNAIPPYAEVADWLLFDAKPAQNAVLPGGNGTPFDWSLLAKLRVSKPWLLAGGLTPENVSAAIEATGAMGVDVSSGVETAPGVKDPAKISEFIAKARQSAEALGFSQAS